MKNKPNRRSPSPLVERFSSGGCACKHSGIYSNPSRFKDGGNIQNKYENKNPEEIWNSWTFEQKKHFVEDHEILDLNQVKMIALKEYKHLDEDTISALLEHISEAEYKDGGSVKIKDSDKKIFSLRYYVNGESVAYSDNHTFDEAVEKSKNDLNKKSRFLNGTYSDIEIINDKTGAVKFYINNELYPDGIYYSNIDDFKKDETHNERLGRIENELKRKGMEFDNITHYENTWWDRNDYIYSTELSGKDYKFLYLNPSKIKIGKVQRLLLIDDKYYTLDLQSENDKKFKTGGTIKSKYYAKKKGEFWNVYTKNENGREVKAYWSQTRQKEIAERDAETLNNPQPFFEQGGGVGSNRIIQIGNNVEILKEANKDNNRTIQLNPYKTGEYLDTKLEGEFTIKSDDGKYNFHGQLRFDNKGLIKKYTIIIDGKEGEGKFDTYTGMIRVSKDDAETLFHSLKDRIERKVENYETSSLKGTMEYEGSKYEKGGSVKKRFIKKVKNMHKEIDEVILKDGTHIKGKDLMEQGGEVDELDFFSLKRFLQLDNDYQEKLILEEFQKGRVHKFIDSAFSPLSKLVSATAEAIRLYASFDKETPISIHGEDIKVCFYPQKKHIKSFGFMAATIIYFGHIVSHGEKDNENNRLYDANREKSIIKWFTILNAPEKKYAQLHSGKLNAICVKNIGVKDADACFILKLEFLSENLLRVHTILTNQRKNQIRNKAVSERDFRTGIKEKTSKNLYLEIHSFNLFPNLIVSSNRDSLRKETPLTSDTNTNIQQNLGLSKNFNKNSQNTDNHEFEEGGTIDSDRRFHENDYNRLIQSNGGFEGRWSGFVWEIYKEGENKVLGKFNPKKRTLFIAGKKDLSNPLVKYLQEYSYVSSDEYQKLEEGGGLEDLISKAENTHSVSIIEKMLGRKLHWWDDDVVTIDGAKYKKVFLQDFYEKI